MKLEVIATAQVETGRLWVREAQRKIWKKGNVFFFHEEKSFSSFKYQEVPWIVFWFLLSVKSWRISCQSKKRRQKKKVMRWRMWKWLESPKRMTKWDFSPFLFLFFLVLCAQSLEFIFRTGVNGSDLFEDGGREKVFSFVIELLVNLFYCK